MKKNIPHFFTSLNLTCGCIAILLLSNDNYNASVIFCLLAFLFDYADGFFARLLKKESAFGKELDSFSDFVTSGVVPGLVMYKLLDSLHHPLTILLLNIKLNMFFLLQYVLLPKCFHYLKLP